MKNKIAFISGHFNIVHPGHLRLFRFAKECCDYLIVGVESDKIAGDAAHLPEEMRVEGVQSNIWVDEVIMIDESISTTILKIKPDIVIKGKEFESKFKRNRSQLTKSCHAVNAASHPPRRHPALRYAALGCWARDAR